VCVCVCVCVYLKADDPKQSEAGILNKVSTEDQHTASWRERFRVQDSGFRFMVQVY